MNRLSSLLVSLLCFFIEIMSLKYSILIVFYFCNIPMRTYDEFWEILKWAYPISRWDITLPICTKLIHIPDLDIQSFLQNIRDIYLRLVAVSQDKQLLWKYCPSQLINMMTWDYTWMIRFDCILDTTWRIKLLELNADYPDWILMHDYTYWVLLDWKKSTNHFDKYIQFFDKNKTLFILYKKQFFLDSFYLEYTYLLDLWYSVFIWTRDDLSFQNWTCYYQWTKIEQIRSCMDMSKFTSDQIKILAYTNVYMVNSYDLWTLANKALLQEVDHDYIPKTQNLTHDIVDYIINHKDNYVIKPIDMYEWIGVYLWVNTTDEEWKKIVEQHKDTNYIAQEFVDMQKMKVQMYENGGTIEKEVYFDICPHLFVKHGKIIWDGLVLMRFSENRILNVAQWGWIGYLNLLS